MGSIKSVPVLVRVNRPDNTRFKFATLGTLPDTITRIRQPCKRLSNNWKMGCNPTANTPGCLDVFGSGSFQKPEIAKLPTGLSVELYRIANLLAVRQQPPIIGKIRFLAQFGTEIDNSQSGWARHRWLAW